MNNPETDDALNKKVKAIRRRAERMISQGIIGEGPFKLEKTLECHMQIKNSLEQMNYILQKDIPEATVLNEISNIEKEIKLIQKNAQQ